MSEIDRLTGLVGYSGVKVPVAVCATTNITLSGEQTIDGVTTAESRVLLTGQTDQTENGIWISDSGDWNRAPDCDGPYDLRQGSVVNAYGGTSNAGFWVCTAANPVDIETDNITFIRSSTTLVAISAFWQGVLGTANAAAARTALDAQEDVTTTIGDSIVATTAGAAARLAAAATVAAHATTMNPWSARTVALSGGAVTFTDIADAPYAGAVAWVKQNAAHIWTNGATFNVQGNDNYTAEADDWIRIYATTVSTFEITVFRADGGSPNTGTSASTFTFDGGGGTSGSATMTYQKVGKFVTLHIPAVSATSGTGSTTFTSNTALPASIRPSAATQNVSINNVLDNAVTGGTAGVATISTSGVVVIKRAGSATAWTNTAAGGIAEGNTVTYFVG